MATKKKGTYKPKPAKVTLGELPGMLAPPKTGVIGVNPGAGLNPYASAVPAPDPSLEAYNTSARRNGALADANATYQNAQIENEYGLGSDTSNPFSRAKLYETNFRRSQAGTQNSYANAGQLYSGQYGVAQGEDNRNYSIGYDQLARQYGAAKKGVQLGQLGAAANNATGMDDASFNSLVRNYGG